MFVDYVTTAAANVDLTPSLRLASELCMERTAMVAIIHDIGARMEIAADSE
jgi:ABC-type hemin transport system ATPase subunit